MNVVDGFPPNYADILKAFPLVAQGGAIFAWDTTIYNPSRVVVDDPLFVHEITHRDQQAGDPAGWWQRYIADPQFRLDQETPAHIVEMFKRAEKGSNRNFRRWLISMMAKRLTNRIYAYGPLMPLHKAETLFRLALANGPAPVYLPMQD